jgi:hypothetical protein
MGKISSESPSIIQTIGLRVTRNGTSRIECASPRILPDRIKRQIHSIVHFVRYAMRLSPMVAGWVPV